MTERAILAGGCFWGMQQLIRRMPGVVSTRVGYTGGDVANATYRIHGTHDTRKIGRRSSNGCVGLYNEHIQELFDMAKVGTQVLLI